MGSENCRIDLITTLEPLIGIINNTSASFDTILGIRGIGSESCITHFDYLLEPLIRILQQH